MLSKLIIWFTFILIAFGLIMLSSAGIYLSQKYFKTSYYYFNHQLIFGLIPGLILFLITSKINVKFWKKISFPLILLSLFLLLLVFFPKIGIAIKGAKRWVDFGFFSFQPAEILKLTLIIYLASFFSSKSHKNKSNSIAVFLVILTLITIFLASQPDIGTLGIIIFIALTMFFASGINLKEFFGIILLIILIFFLLIGFSSYRFNRILVFLNPDYDVKGVGYHLNQSLISIGKGGLFGVGFGKGEQKLGFLPEPVGDSIFAVIGEELGFLGMIFTITLILVFIVFSIIVGKKAERKLNDKFSSLYATGLASWVGIQSFTNIASLSGIIPLTGVPLPLISYGGTSLAVLMAGIGILVKIAKEVG